MYKIANAERLRRTMCPLYSFVQNVQAIATTYICIDRTLSVLFHSALVQILWIIVFICVSNGQLDETNRANQRHATIYMAYTYTHIQTQNINRDVREKTT